MFRLAAIPVCLTLLAAFSNAPFLHLHSHGDTEHVRRAHGAATPHAHFGAHNPGAGICIAAQDGDDDAVPLSWLQQAPGWGPELVFEAVEFPLVPMPAATLSRVAAPSPRGHDPPARPPLAPRSPPGLPAFQGA